MSKVHFNNVIITEGLFKGLHDGGLRFLLGEIVEDQCCANTKFGRVACFTVTSDAHYEFLIVVLESFRHLFGEFKEYKVFLGSRFGQCLKFMRSTCIITFIDKFFEDCMASRFTF